MRLCDSDNFEGLFEYALTFKDANLFNRDGQYGGPGGPFLCGLTTTKHFITKIEKLWTTEKG